MKRLLSFIAGAAATISPVSNTAGHLGAPTSGNHWQLVRLTNGSIGGGGPAYDTNVWGIDTVGMNNMVIGWDLRAK